jgi:hypothetical protein
MMTCLSPENYVVLNRSPPATGGHFNVGHNISVENTYPRKSKVSVFVPARIALARASRPNATSRVFSGWRVSPYLANLLGSTCRTFSGILTVLDARHSIVGVADYKHLAPEARLHVALDPFIEYKMKVLLARSGLMICPCPVPVSLTSSRPASITPVLIHFRISLRMLASPYPPLNVPSPFGTTTLRSYPAGK